MIGEVSRVFHEELVKIVLVEGGDHFRSGHGKIFDGETPAGAATAYNLPNQRRNQSIRDLMIVMNNLWHVCILDFWAMCIYLRSMIVR